jgi:hypothetical protein
VLTHLDKPGARAGRLPVPLATQQLRVALAVTAGAKPDFQPVARKTATAGPGAGAVAVRLALLLAPAETMERQAAPVEAGPHKVMAVPVAAQVAALVVQAVAAREAQGPNTPKPLIARPQEQAVAGLGAEAATVAITRTATAAAVPLVAPLAITDQAEAEAEAEVAPIAYPAMMVAMAAPARPGKLA